MSRKRRRNKKNNKALSNTIEKSVDNLKDQIKEIVPKAPVQRVEPKQPEPVSAPQYPDKVQQILDTGEYEVIGNVLRKNGADVGFTLSPAFIASLENPKTLASFINPAPKTEVKEEPVLVSSPESEPEPEKHDAEYYHFKDINQITKLEQWIESAKEPVALTDQIREQVREYLDTVEYFMFAMRKQLDNGNDLTSLGAQCLAQYLYACHNLRNIFKDFIYEDD